MNTEDDEFARIEREIKIKSSGMDCCTYDCTQGRDCPVRKAKQMNDEQLKQLAKQSGMQSEPPENVLALLRNFFESLKGKP